MYVCMNCAINYLFCFESFIYIVVSNDMIPFCFILF